MNSKCVICGALIVIQFYTGSCIDPAHSCEAVHQPHTEIVLDVEQSGQLATVAGSPDYRITPKTGTLGITGQLAMRLP